MLVTIEVPMKPGFVWTTDRDKQNDVTVRALDLLFSEESVKKITLLDGEVSRVSEDRATLVIAVEVGALRYLQPAFDAAAEPVATGTECDGGAVG